MFRKFIFFTVALICGSIALSEESNILDYRKMGPKEQAQSYLVKLQDPDGSVRRDGASLLSRVIEQQVPNIGSSKEGDAFLIEIGSGVTGLAQMDNSTIRVRAERLLDQLVHGYMAAASSNSEPMKAEGLRGLKFLGARTNSGETRSLISGALSKAKEEIPPFDPILVIRPTLNEQKEPPRLAPESISEDGTLVRVAEKDPTIPSEPPAPQPETTTPPPPPPETARVEETAKPAPAAQETAVEQPSASKPKKIVVRSLTGGYTAPLPAAAAETQVVTVSLKGVKKTDPPKKPSAPEATPAPSQERVVLKMLAEKLMANDEGGKLIGLDLAKKLSENVIRAAASDDLDLKSYAQNATLALRRLIADSSPQVRGRACEITGLIKDRQSAPQLITRLEDSDEAVKKAAQGALNAISGKDLGENPADWKSEFGL